MRPLVPAPERSDDEGRRRCRYTPAEGGGCDGSGFLLDEDENVTRECRCRPELITRARARNLSREIPPRYREFRLSDRRFDAALDPMIIREIRRYARSIKDELSEGRGLFLFGDRGTGKTALAMAVAAEVTDKHSVAIYNARELVSTLMIASKDGYAGENVLQRLDRYAAVDLLVIDDLAVATGHEWIQQLIYSVINRRYEDKRAMLITADVTSPEKIADHIGWRSASRLLEVCEPIPIFGHDRRLVVEPQRSN